MHPHVVPSRPALALLATGLLAILFTQNAKPSEIFVEAESFRSSGGWTVIDGPAAKLSSGLAQLSGATGDPKGVATATVSVKDAGKYHIWVRYSSQEKYRGPFHVTALAGNAALADGLFDAEFEGKKSRDPWVWRSFDAVLPEGEGILQLSKDANQNCSGAARQVDCLLLTMDDSLVPNHLNYGAQTFVRFTLGEGYDKPIYLHIFADHFHAPWYRHYSLGRSGAADGLAVKKPDLLGSGERSAWCNITPLLFQDSGAMLFITARHSYSDYAERLRATLEFATAPDEKAIVRTMKLDNQPGTVAIFTPPNLLTSENRALFKTDQEIANETGRLADDHAWPTYGKPLQKFPFFVSESIDNSTFPRDARVTAREERTLAYFGYTPNHLRHVGGAWLMKDNSYCNPEVDKMKATITANAAKFREAGGKVSDIVFSELTDEPTGQSLEFASHDPSYVTHFRDWLKGQGLAPSDLLVPDWEAVKIVTGAARDTFPALYYYSQRFRTQALGDFMAAQRKLVEAAYGAPFPVLANFSDGAVYVANFYAQGVDYFALLDSPDQNAIWGEDWSNGASTYQCASFNVDLMRAAARERGQVIGHYLVAHAGRKAWDIKLKATSELARGVKIMTNFCYGPSWATHEGGPYWRSSVWQAKPETWTANAAITREVGAVEDLLLTAMPAPAKVALLYSSSSDIWTVDDTSAYGFDRMHTWLALTHAQVPVDILSEAQVAKGMLKDYAVCYLSGPNLTRAAADKLKDWVEQGGTLWLTAGAASRDEFNRPLPALDSLLPADRSPVADLQKHRNSGAYLNFLIPKDQVHWSNGQADVLALKQTLTPRSGSQTLATFQDGSPALIHGSAGQGKVYCVGFLPALSYIKSALDQRNELRKKVADQSALRAEEKKDAEILDHSANPWKFPSELRDLILTPAREAKIAPPLECSVPMVDAVYMTNEKGILIPLANYTNQAIPSLTLKVTTLREVGSLDSAIHGAISFKRDDDGSVKFALPLDNNDFVALRYR